jgi:hypothetical protein
MNFQEVFMRRRIIVLVTLALGSVVLLADEQKSKIERSPAYDKMKTLVGSWEGAANEGNQKIPTNARFKMISDDSALMAWLNEGSKNDEMITMFHMDGSDLMATHYCAAHNQPRMVLISGGDQNRLVFKFKDGTNIQPDAGHMQQVAFVIDGLNHHIEEWTYLQNGKEDTTRFDFRRKQ